MSALEKAAWFQLVICLAAVAAVAFLYPWFGQRATGGFAVMSLAALTVGNRVAVDERDREIERRSTAIAVGATWMAMISILAVAGTWANYSEVHTVSTVFLNWLLWSQFAACYGIKALASIIAYRRQRYAA